MPTSPLAAVVSSVGATSMEGTEVADRASNVDQAGLAALGQRRVSSLRCGPRRSVVVHGALASVEERLGPTVRHRQAVDAVRSAPRRGESGWTDGSLSPTRRA